MRKPGEIRREDLPDRHFGMSGIGQELPRTMKSWITLASVPDSIHAVHSFPNGLLFLIIKQKPLIDLFGSAAASLAYSIPQTGGTITNAR